MLVSNIFSPEKEPTFLERNNWILKYDRNIQNYLKYLIVPESNKVLKTNKLMHNNEHISKGSESFSNERALNGQSRKI